MNCAAVDGIELPLGVTTVIGTGPASLPAGAIANMSVSLSITNSVADNVPKSTSVALLNPEPEI